MRRLAFVLLTLAVLAAGCGGGGGAFDTTTTAATTSSGAESTSSSSEATTSAPTTEATTTTEGTTTTTTLATTTTAAPVYLVDTSNFFPGIFPGVTNGAHGSGCVTPGFDHLPNGVWFGYAEGVGGGVITFDLACFFTGSVACDAQIEDGFAANPSECIDFWIRNNVPTTFAVPISPTARVWYVDMVSPDPSVPTEIPLTSWPTPASFQTCPGQYCAVWLYVNGGQATAIVEQYLP
jgi:hypothetical protein